MYMCAWVHVCHEGMCVSDRQAAGGLCAGMQTATRVRRGAGLVWMCALNGSIQEESVHPWAGSVPTLCKRRTSGSRALTAIMRTPNLEGFINPRCASRPTLSLCPLEPSGLRDFWVNTAPDTSCTACMHTHN